MDLLILRISEIGVYLTGILIIDLAYQVVKSQNSEDRYIFQQLTRYYHGLIESKQAKIRWHR
jgi:hypothetical protein